LRAFACHHAYSHLQLASCRWHLPSLLYNVSRSCHERPPLDCMTVPCMASNPLGRCQHPLGDAIAPSLLSFLLLMLAGLEGRCWCVATNVVATSLELVLLLPLVVFGSRWLLMGVVPQQSKCPPLDGRGWCNEAKERALWGRRGSAWCLWHHTLCFVLLKFVQS
jgi:hypothetical protein